METAESGFSHVGFAKTCQELSVLPSIDVFPNALSSLIMIWLGHFHKLYPHRGTPLTLLQSAPAFIIFLAISIAR